MEERDYLYVGLEQKIQMILENKGLDKEADYEKVANKVYAKASKGKSKKASANKLKRQSKKNKNKQLYKI